MDRWIRKETENVTEITERNGVVLLTFPVLDALGTVRGGFSTRHGGVSTGHLAEMNFSWLSVFPRIHSWWRTRPTP